mmetsp:Transcript_17081/g.12233  ORF Transcript_17081/g.12233 Transcript_17081/m.12233 type:complete len:98 (+) Transcript_17081:321-614(+)
MSFLLSYESVYYLRKCSTKTHTTHEHPCKKSTLADRVATNSAYTGGYICNECRSSTVRGENLSYSCAPCTYDLCIPCHEKFAIRGPPIQKGQTHQFH